MIPAILLTLIEKLVMSPVVQEEAWALIKPHLIDGTMPSHETIVLANMTADAAHAAAQAP